MSGNGKPVPVTYDLDEEMLATLANEFPPQQIVEQFAQALAGNKKQVDKVAGQFFSDFGRRWMKRAHELGEEHSDVTYETLKKAVAKTGVMYFPMVPQRFVEIAYLGIMSFLTIGIVQNNSEKLVYRIKPCDIYQGLQKKLGDDVAKLLPCRYACLAALDTLMQELKIKANLDMEATMPQKGYCQFCAAKA